MSSKMLNLNVQACPLDPKKKLFCIQCHPEFSHKSVALCLDKANRKAVWLNFPE